MWEALRAEERRERNVKRNDRGKLDKSDDKPDKEANGVERMGSEMKRKK